MKINFSKWDFGGKLIFISTVLATLSLFMTWVDLGIFKASGFQQEGYIFLILYIYPIYKLLKGRSINKVIGLICGVLSIVSSVAFLISKSVDVFGSTVNAAGTGLYVFIIASIGLVIGVFKYNAVYAQGVDIEK